MKLNKYAGRSFDDINQYPIFPWVQFYSDQKSISRILKYPMAAQTPEKRKAADKTLSESYWPFGSKSYPYQFGSHYLPGRAVLGYLLRLPPYTSLWIDFDSGGDDANRIFSSMEVLSQNSQIKDYSLELIPEFYYLPELFINV